MKKTIKDLRELQNLTQKDVAKKTGKTVTYISLIEMVIEIQVTN